MSTPIAEDFADIRARWLAIRAAERPAAAAPAEEPPPPIQAGAGDFYAWLMGGGLSGGGPG